MTAKGQTGTHNVIHDASPSRYHSTHEVVLVRVTDPDPAKAALQLAEIIAGIATGAYPPHETGSGTVYDFVSAHMDGRRIVGVVQMRIADSSVRLPYKRGNVGRPKRV